MRFPWACSEEDLDLHVAHLASWRAPPDDALSSGLYRSCAPERCAVHSTRNFCSALLLVTLTVVLRTTVHVDEWAASICTPLIRR